jgi:sugar phosphate isomerase/epimerase
VPDRLRDRFGCRPGGTSLEEGLEWAAGHGFRFLEFTADYGPDALSEWSGARAEQVREYCGEHGLALTIHTLSGVNVAEFSPFLSEAVDAYLAANIDLAAKLDANVIVHAGIHFSHQMDLRLQASLEHLQRAVGHAEAKGVQLLLENLNFEPDDAEVHYLGHSVEELRRCFDAIASPNLTWGFVPNHAHLLPGDFDSFLDAFGIDRIGMVLVADCRGTVEEHLVPGAGTLDFKRLFERLEEAGYQGPYILTFGDREEKVAGRDYILDLLA